MSAALFQRKINYSAHQLEVKPSLIHGQGVFSKTVFRSGQLIEKAPVILIDDAEKELLTNSSLHHYYFLVNDTAKPIAMGLGYSALYNHAVDANAGYSIDIINLYITIKACKKIAAGEEITINYNGRPGDSSLVYFSNNN